MPKIKEPLEKRFWEKVHKTDNCWFWVGAMKSGYGAIRDEKRKRIGAHQASWILHFGPIPLGKHVLHKCDVPQCVRPDHLFVGSISENLKDAFAKGRKMAPDNRGERHGMSKLSEEQVLSIRTDRKAGMKFRELAAKYHISEMSAWNAATGRYWKHI